MVSGVIALWHGSAASIPAGWVLCDGNNDTPDLRDRFVVGAESTYAPDDSGGSATHTHGFTTDGHNHTLDDGEPLQVGEGGKQILSSTDTGTTDAGSTLPPYYALCYIMKT